MPLRSSVPWYGVPPAVSGTWAQATSWPASAQGSSPARTARTVSHRSPSSAANAGSLTSPPPAGTASGNAARGTPSASTSPEKDRWDRSRKPYVVRTVTELSAKENATGSYTFLRSSSPGDGVRSGNTSPSMTKFPSCTGSP